eukprot:gene11874-12018_t
MEDFNAAFNAAAANGLTEQVLPTTGAAAPDISTVTDAAAQDAAATQEVNSQANTQPVPSAPVAPPSVLLPQQQPAAIDFLGRSCILCSGIGDRGDIRFGRCRTDRTSVEDCLE